MQDGGAGIGRARREASGVPAGEVGTRAQRHRNLPSHEPSPRCISTTPPPRRCAPEVLEAMLPGSRARFGNPSSAHRLGREARVALDEARERVAGVPGRPSRRGVLHLLRHRGRQLRRHRRLAGRPRARGAPPCVTTPIEHKAVLAACHQVGTRGWDGTFRSGRRPWAWWTSTPSRAACDDALAVASVMWVNNETGVVQDIPALTDARQGARRPHAHRRRAGVRQGRHRPAHAAGRPAHDQRPQDRRAQGNRRAVHPSRRDARAADARRLAGSRPPSRHRERALRHGARHWRASWPCRSGEREVRAPAGAARAAGGARCSTACPMR